MSIPTYFPEAATPGKTTIRFRVKGDDVLSDRIIRDLRSLIETKAFCDDVRYWATLIKNSEMARKTGKDKEAQFKEEVDTILNTIALYNKYPYYGYNFILVACKEEQYNGWYMLYNHYRECSQDEIIYLTNKLYEICDNTEIDIEIE